MRLHRRDGAIGGLGERLLGAKAITPQLMSDVLAACGLDEGDPTPAASHLRNLNAAQAWNDAALGLVEIELPRWQIARLVFDDGDWHCALSKHSQMPEWLDDAVEARHEVLSLAILTAFVEARETEFASTIRAPGPTPRINAQDNGLAPALCCENFA